MSPRKPSERQSEVQRCIDAYYRSFVLRFNPAKLDDGRTRGEAWLADMADPDYKKKPRSVPQEQMALPIILGGKDGTNIKRLIAAWGFEKVLAYCEAFPFLTSWEVRNSDYSLAVLYAKAQKLLVASQQPGQRAGRNADQAARAVSGGAE